MDVLQLIQIIAPTAILSAILTFVVARSKEKRTDFSTITEMLKEDNDRLRLKEKELEARVDEQAIKILKLEKNVSNLQNKLILLESAHNDSPLPMWLKDENGVMMALNEPYILTFLKPLGKSRDDYIGQDDFAMWPAEVAKQFRKHDKLAEELGFVDTFEDVPNGNGDLIRFRIIKYARYLGNHVIGIAGIAIPQHETDSKNRKRFLKS